MKKILFLACVLFATSNLFSQNATQSAANGPVPIPDSQWLGTNTNTANTWRNGNVSIGTSSTTDGLITYKLSVNGKIRATSVKVYTGWADYVFEKEYQLPTLTEVENFIKQNGHLKDIPSAATVAEEGIDLGEMNKLLLQKIEELTLYLIELNKEIETLKDE